MSTNIHFVAKREISFKKKNGDVATDIQTEYFAVWQSPTRVTHEIMQSVSPVDAYIDWVKRECSRPQELKVYADDDIWSEREPVGVEVYNPGEDHIAEFKDWVCVKEEQGYTIEAEAW